MDFKKLPPMPSADELIERAFTKASRGGTSRKRKKRPDRIRERERARVNAVHETVSSVFEKYQQRVPDLETLSPFYRELVDLLVGVERMEKALGTLQWFLRKGGSLRRRASSRIRKAGTEAEIFSAKSAFYGQYASLLRRIDPQLRLLEEARGRLKDLPTLEEEFTVVIAGLPNVGKSSLLRTLTTAKPRVDRYPFTTQQLLLGSFEREFLRYQVVDTPGLLDRPLSKRNRIELQAIAALRHLADVVLFLFDPSETCGYSLKEQREVYEDLLTPFGERVIPVVHKADLLEAEEIAAFLEGLERRGYICSSKTGEGLEDLIEEIVRRREETEKGLGEEGLKSQSAEEEGKFRGGARSPPP
jgi:nucleolar GTP-binding protein